MEDQTTDSTEVQVESLVSTDEPAPKRRGRPRKETAAKADDSVILLHFVEDGFTADGAVWVRGQELEYHKGTAEYEQTLDRNGVSWLDLVGDEAAQMDRFGKVMFRPGPWPYDEFEDEAAAKAERKRGRKPPKLDQKV